MWLAPTLRDTFPRFPLGSCYAAAGAVITSCLAPVEDEFALGEVPAAVELGEGVEVAEGGDHDLAVAVFGVDVVGDRVALAGRAVTLERDGALPVEVRGHLVAIEVVEDGRQRFSPMKHVGRLAAFALHVDGEDGVVGEERLLPFGVTTVGAVRVRVEELPQGKPVGGLGGTEFCVSGHQ
jgi:hypothetical protein